MANKAASFSFGCIAILYCAGILLVLHVPALLLVSAHKHGGTHKCSCGGKSLRNITVYNYLSIQGPNSTAGYNAVQCGQPLLPQPNFFASQFCFDMPLLLKKDLNSTLLGVVQGTYVFADLAAPGNTLFVSETFTLNTTATPQGSFSAAGLERIGHETSKPITGGTGAFAFLVGIAVTTPLSMGVDANGNFVSWFKYEFAFRSTTCPSS